MYILLSVTLNITTDAYLILIPVPMLWGTQLPTFKKLTLVVVFSGALFVMAAGLLRGILILKVRHPASLHPIIKNDRRTRTQ